MYLRAVLPGCSRDLLDLLGLGLSALCLVHCIALRLVLIALPTLATFGHVGNLWLIGAHWINLAAGRTPVTAHAH
jgi:hypothetical protein